MLICVPESENKKEVVADWNKPSKCIARPEQLPIDSHVRKEDTIFTLSIGIRPSEPINILDSGESFQ